MGLFASYFLQFSPCEMISCSPSILGLEGDWSCEAGCEMLRWLFVHWGRLCLYVVNALMQSEYAAIFYKQPFIYLFIYLFIYISV